MKGNEGKGRGEETRKVELPIRETVYVIRRSEHPNGGVIAVEGEVERSAITIKRSTSPCFPWEAEARISSWIEERKKRGAL